MMKAKHCLYKGRVSKIHRIWWQLAQLNPQDLTNSLRDHLLLEFQNTRVLADHFVKLSRIRGQRQYNILKMN